MTATGTLPPATTDDVFLGGALHILQPRDGYRAGLDAVLLAAAAPVEAGLGQRVLDVGTGVGVVGLAVARRVGDARLTLVERDPEMAGCARANIERNGLAERVRLIEADVARPLGEAEDLRAAAQSFDHVLANPPYHVEGRGTAAGDAAKAAAHAMPDGGLERWLRFMAAMTRSGGTATLIHRADALGEILAGCAGRFGGLAVLPLHAKDGEPAGRVLVQGTKGSRAPLVLLPGVVLHGPDGKFRPEIEAVLRAGAPFRVTRV